jgi:hypothetical protein
MFWYCFKDIKNFKYWGKNAKRVFICDMIWNLILIALGVVLYIFLEDTGLLIYLISMIKFHWFREELD